MLDPRRSRLRTQECGLEIEGRGRGMVLRTAAHRTSRLYYRPELYLTNIVGAPRPRLKEVITHY